MYKSILKLYHLPRKKRMDADMSFEQLTCSRKTWTMTQAKSDFERGLLKGVAIYFIDVLPSAHYTVSFESALNTDGSGALVDARTAKVREFRTMDAVHSAIRRVGFRPMRFWVSAK